MGPPRAYSRRKLARYQQWWASLPWYAKVFERIDQWLNDDAEFAPEIPEGYAQVGGLVFPAEAVVEPVCPGGPAGCLCSCRNGIQACRLVREWYETPLHSRNVGTFTIDDFAGSPQQHAILNRHLLDYFRDRRRSQETTPYAIPPSQQHLLFDLGMERPQPDAPVVPHGLHKSIEESQLHRMRNYLNPNGYNLVCVKPAKVAKLPPPATTQNPLREAKDPSRFPGSALQDADFTVSDVHFMHDVASAVTPHELVEKLAAERPEAHLFVTGMNPIEVLDRAQTCEPSSHTIQYTSTHFNYVFTGSEEEAYYTPIAVTEAWINTNSVVARDGRVYQVCLLENKLGHCLYHIFCGDVTAQESRTYSTGSYVRLPPAVSGTFRHEFVQSRLITAVLSFVTRTPDLSTRNLYAKIAQVGNTLNPRPTAREHWVAWHVASQLAPYKDALYYLRHVFWRALYVATFQWHMLTTEPDLFQYLSERQRHVQIFPTEGGGWSPHAHLEFRLQAIPNRPTILQQCSVWTAAAFVYIIPKLALGEVLTFVATGVDLVSYVSKVLGWLDLKPLRVLLTATVMLSALVVPGHILRYFSHVSGHYFRQLWLPGYIQYLVSRGIAEVCGAPGCLLFAAPGGGWAWQCLLWAVALHSFVPGLVPALVVPWVAFTTGHSVLMTLWLSVVALENFVNRFPTGPFVATPPVITRRHYRSWNQLSCLRVQCHWTPFVTVPVSQTRIVTRAGVRRQLTRSTLHCASGRGFTWQNLASRRMLSAVPTVRLAGSGSLLLMAADDVTDVALALYRGFKKATNIICRMASTKHVRVGNCPRAPSLPSTVVQPPAPVRRRNVDKTLPAVVVQPLVPVAPVGPQIAIPPDGLTFPDWLQQVEAAYRAQPALHPLLTPGQDCFWQAVSSLGGTPHMWFSWFMEFMRRRVPAAQGVVGGVTIIDMHMFAAVSGIGVRLSGVTDEVTLSRDGRPTLNIRLTHVPMSLDLHAEIAPTPSTSDRTAPLSRILRTLQQHYPNWANDVTVAFQQAPQDSVPVPTPTLRAILQAYEFPSSMQDIADALFASFSARPFTVAAPEGFNLVLAGAPAQGDPLFEYLPPIARTRVALTPNDKRWAKLYEKTVGANARQSRDNATRNNARPEPPMWVTLMGELREKLKDYMTGYLPDRPLVRETVMYTADLDRASRLVADLKAHPSVLGGKADAKWLQSLDSVLDLYRLEGKTVTVPVHAYFGLGGCGKTTETAKYLRSLGPEARQMARVVLHTESLRAQAKRDLDFPEMRGVNFPTLPGILSEPTTGPIVFDDAGKFYGGVLDLVLLVNPLVPEVVVNGDPAQQLSKFPVGGTQSEFDIGPMVIARQTTEYATRSHRWFTLLAQMFGAHTTNPIRGHVTHTVGPKPGIPVTTTSPRYVQVLSSAGRQAYTHDTIQGEDFDDDVEVDMSALEEAISDRSAYVALSRSKRGVYLHMNAADPRSLIKAPPTGSDLMNAIIYSMRQDNLPTLLNGNALIRGAFYAHLHSCMPNLKWFRNVGASIHPDAYQLVVPACTDTVPDSGTVTDCVSSDAAPSSSAPVEGVVPETHWGDKEAREVPFAGIQTDQFKECAFVNPHVHKRQDHATYRLTVDKRITHATPAANYTRKKKCPRREMIDTFDSLVPDLPTWTPEKHVAYMDQARREYESGRTEQAVLAKLASHDPERSGCDVVNSLKAQVIKKEEKRHKFSAIPGQLIYEYDIKQTLEDAAYALFLENEVFDAFPKQFLFYRRLNPDQFIDEYVARWRVGNGVHTSDITRWDVGCDAGVLNFDEHLFRRCRFPEQYVADYVYRRLHTVSQHGQLQTGQPSGDRFTWVLNSIRRAVVAAYVLCLRNDDTVAINGDDEALDRCAEGREFPDSVWEFKDQNGPVGEFSGFELGGPVPTYSAQGIHYRTMILVSRDPSAQEKWVNYMQLLSYADLDTWEAADVARLARQHMKPELFERTLPDGLRKLFA